KGGTTKVRGDYRQGGLAARPRLKPPRRYVLPRIGALQDAVGVETRPFVAALEIGDVPAHPMFGSGRIALAQGIEDFAMRVDYTLMRFQFGQNRVTGRH